MKRAISNIRRQRLKSSLPLLLPALAVPLALVGVVATPALKLHNAKLEDQRATERVVRAEVTERALEQWGSTDQLDSWKEEVKLLQSLIPHKLSPLEIYSWTCIAARTVGIEVDSIAIEEQADDLGIIVGDETIRQYSMRLSCVGDLNQVLALRDELISLGLPHATRSLGLARPNAESSRYRIDLHLGFFERNAAAKSTDQSIPLVP